MRKNIILLCSALILNLFAFSVSAQDAQMNIEQFEARMMEYVKAAAGLTQEEAAKYFPLSRELTRKKLDLHRSHREKVEQMQRSQTGMTDEEFRLLLENDVEVRRQQAALDVLYNEKFLRFLSPERLYNAQRAERAFMMRELVNFREQQ